MHPQYHSLRSALMTLTLGACIAGTAGAATLVERLTTLQCTAAGLETRVFLACPSDADTPFVARTFEVLRTAVEQKTLDPSALARLTLALPRCHRSLNFVLTHDMSCGDALARYDAAVAEQQRLLDEVFPAMTAPDRGLKAKIVDAANGAVGVSSPLYGVQTHTELTGHPDYPGTFPGYLSCARVASAILQHAGAGKGIHSACLAFDRALSGWKKVGPDSLEWGDVVFWASGPNDVRPRHTGIHVGTFAAVDWTVDNNSLLGRVVKRPLRRVEWDVFHGRRPPN